LPIALEDSGFISWNDATETPALGIQSDQISACISEVQRRELLGIFGTRPYFRETDLYFLRELPNLRAVAIWDIRLTDISALYDLRDLRYLRLGADRPSIDFARLPTLRTLVWSHRRGDVNAVTLPGLKFLHIWRFKSPSGDLSDLDLPSSLTELGIYWFNAKTVEGLSFLPNLLRLEIARCRNLASIHTLAEACPNLQHLVVTASGRVTVPEAERLAEKMPNLRHFYAANKLIRSSENVA
jgi:hypothetical protein